MKKRSYKQNCSLALSTDLLGERWTILILRELLIQPCRFKQLNQWLNGMGTNLLTNRLKELESAKLVVKQHPNEKRSAYQLTSLGRSVEPILLEYIRWGFLHLSPSDGYTHFAHWDLLAMKALFIGHNCNTNIVVQFVNNDLTAWVMVSPSGFDFTIAEHANPDILINSNITTFKQQLDEGDLHICTMLGDFLKCFDINVLVPNDNNV